MSTILNPFGGTDEQAMTDQFEEICGGVSRASRLRDLFRNGYFKTDAAFIRAAVADGFTPAQCNAFLSLS